MAPKESEGGAGASYLPIMGSGTPKADLGYAAEYEMRRLHVLSFEAVDSSDSVKIAQHPISKVTFAKSNNRVS